MMKPTTTTPSHRYRYRCHWIATSRSALLAMTRTFVIASTQRQLHIPKQSTDRTAQPLPIAGTSLPLEGRAYSPRCRCRWHSLPLEGRAYTPHRFLPLEGGGVGGGENNESLSPKLPPLSGLKLLAVLGVLCCHTGMIPTFDACARMVEILFVLSGFLMAYNHFLTTEEHTLSAGWQNVKRKLPKFYPIHLFTFLLQAIFVAYWAEKPLSYLFSVGTLNLTLQHAWFIETEFSYNNVSWFLSALMFAYLLTPTLAGVVKRLGTNLTALIKFAVFIMLTRTLLEYLTLNRYIRLDLHCNPFVQMLNYALGYAAGVLYIHKNAFNQYVKQKLPSSFLTLLQALCLTLYLLCCIRFNDAWRLFFVLMTLPVIYFTAFPRGGIAKILSLPPLQKLSTLTLEIFMLHSFILYKFPTDSHTVKSYAIFFTLTLAAAATFHWIQHHFPSPRRH